MRSIRTSSTSRFLGIAILSAAVLGPISLKACADSRSEDVAIESATLRSDGSLVVTLDTCNAELTKASVQESAEEVRVAMTVTGDDSNEDCADNFEVVLKQPLGERELIDAKSGSRITVTRL